MGQISGAQPGHSWKALKVQGALREAEADRTTVERELGRLREAIREVARSRADPDRVLAVLDDFRLGYELVQIPAELEHRFRAKPITGSG